MRQQEIAVVNVGLSRAKAIEELTRVLDAIRATTEERSFSETLYGEANDGSRREIQIAFSNDDMEGRPEVADRIIVDFFD